MFGVTKHRRIYDYKEMIVSIVEISNVMTQDSELMVKINIVLIKMLVIDKRFWGRVYLEEKYGRQRS